MHIRRFNQLEKALLISLQGANPWVDHAKIVNKNSMTRSKHKAPAEATTITASVGVEIE
jgi:hypothetical protein